MHCNNLNYKIYIVNFNNLLSYNPNLSYFKYFQLILLSLECKIFKPHLLILSIVFSRKSEYYIISISFKHFSQDHCVFLIHFLARISIIAYSHLWRNYWTNEKEEGRNKGSYNVKMEGKSSFFIFYFSWNVAGKSCILSRRSFLFVSLWVPFFWRMVSEFSWNWTHCCQLDFA